MRLFVGIPVPMELASALAGIASTLPSSCRRIAPEKMHVTLSFLGESPGPTLPCIDTELKAIAHRSFPLAVVGLGTFPGVLFAKLQDEPRLDALAAEIVARLQRCGFPVEQRAYRPHVTLARTQDRRLRVTRSFQPLCFTATEFVLYRSTLGPRGSQYEQIRHCSLSAPA